MRIAFLGDIALVGQFCSVGSNIDYLYSLLKEYDYIIANLESPITKIKTTAIPKSMHLRTDEASVNILQKLKINAVTLANNHSYDYGRKGMDETIQILEKVGIKWFGVDGKTITEVIDGVKLSISGFCCLSTNGTGYSGRSGKGVNTLTRKKLKQQLQIDKKNDAISVVSIHFGIEHTNYPSIEHMALFENIINENKCIIHGHHPHQIQGIQKKNDSLIAYSLGNALFDNVKSIGERFSLNLNEDNRKSFVLGVEIENGVIKDYEANGFYISEDGIVPYNIDQELKCFSDSIENIADETEYQNKRREQYQSVILNKFGSHDIIWLKSRLNYYSVFAKINSIIRARKYKRIKQEFYSKE